MQLTEVQRLTADYTEDDVLEVAAVMQSTFPVTPSSALRWANVDPQEAKSWVRQAVTQAFKQEFQVLRISTLQKQDDALPTATYAEHLVIRDLDLEHLEAPKSNSLPGRVVAHADFRFTLSFGRHPVGQSEDPNHQDPSPSSLPSGFGRELNSLINGKVETTLHDLFQGLPCFELYGISTLTPSHLRKGIAKRLVEWVIPYADEFALPVVLAASPLGLPLYQKCGFEEYRAYDVVVDLEKWGGEGIHRHVMMVRWPTTADKLPAVWKEWKETHTTAS